MCLSKKDKWKITYHASTYVADVNIFFVSLLFKDKKMIQKFKVKK